MTNERKEIVMAADYVITHYKTKDNIYQIPDARQLVEECGWRNEKFIQHTNNPPRFVKYTDLSAAAGELLCYIILAKQTNELLEKYK